MTLKHLKLLLSALIVVSSIVELLGYVQSMPITLLMMAILSGIIGWESHQQNKKESIPVFIAAAFTGLIAIITMF